MGYKGACPQGCRWILLTEEISFERVMLIRQADLVVLLPLHRNVRELGSPTCRNRSFASMCSARGAPVTARPGLRAGPGRYTADHRLRRSDP